MLELLPNELHLIREFLEVAFIVRHQREAVNGVHPLVFVLRVSNGLDHGLDKVFKLLLAFFIDVVEDALYDCLVFFPTEGKLPTEPINGVLEAVVDQVTVLRI